MGESSIGFTPASANYSAPEGHEIDTSQNKPVDNSSWTETDQTKFSVIAKTTRAPVRLPRIFGIAFLPAGCGGEEPPLPAPNPNSSNPPVLPCDGKGLQDYYYDQDDDGFGDKNKTTKACSAPEHYVPDNTDCNDQNGSIRPNILEICRDQVDNNCDGQTDELLCRTPPDPCDRDGDGYRNASCTGSDCNDNRPLVHPDANEDRCNNIDDNCSGITDEGKRSHDYSACYNGDAYWYDECAVREDLKEDCRADQTCSSGNCVFPPSSGPQMVSVGCGTGSSVPDFPMIRNAVNSVATRGTVTLCEGIYHRTVQGSIIINKSVSFIGSGSVTMDGNDICSGGGSSGRGMFWGRGSAYSLSFSNIRFIRGANVFVEGDNVDLSMANCSFELFNDSSCRHDLIVHYPLLGTIRFSHIAISGNRLGTAIYVHSGEHLFMDHITARSNSFDSGYWGLFTLRSANFLIENSTFSSNEETGGVDAVLTFGPITNPTGTIRNSEFSENRSSAVIESYSGAPTLLRAVSDSFQNNRGSDFRAHGYNFRAGNRRDFICTRNNGLVSCE